MNVSEFCIRRPVATLLMSFALIAGRPVRVRPAAGGGAAAHRFPGHQRLGLPARRLARHHGESRWRPPSSSSSRPSRASPPSAPPTRRARTSIVHRVRPRPRHRRGRGRRAIRDLAHPAPAARRHGGRAELSQGQSRRPADPAAGAAQRRDGAVAARRLRPAGDVAAPVDRRRRRPGQRVRQPEIRRAHPGRSERRSRRATSASTNCRTRSRWPTPSRRSASSRTTTRR